MTDLLQQMQEQLTLTTHWVTIVPLLLFLVGASYTDIKTLKIKNVWTGLFFGLALLLPLIHPSISYPFILSGSVAGFVIIFIPAFLANKPMGGDIKLMAVVGAFIGPLLALVVVIIATLLSIGFLMIQAIMKKDLQSSYPFAPFIAIGYVVLIFCQFILT